MMKSIFELAEKRSNEDKVKWKQFMEEEPTLDDKQFVNDFIDKIVQLYHTLQSEVSSPELLERINNIYKNRYTKYNTLLNIMIQRNHLPIQVRLLLSNLFYDYTKQYKYNLTPYIEKEDQLCKKLYELEKEKNQNDNESDVYLRKTNKIKMDLFQNQCILTQPLKQYHKYQWLSTLIDSR